MQAVIATFVLVVGVGLVTGGVALLRWTSRTSRERIPVVAVCVGRTFMSRPSRITFDHPVPGGWRRTTRVESFPTTSATGRLAQPGDHIVVWADPHRPDDVRLSAMNDSRGLLAILLIVLGVLAGLFSLVVATFGTGDTAS